MNAGIDEELRPALAAASDFVQPPGTLADRVRVAVRARRRRRAFVATAAACAVVLAATGLTYVAAGRRHPPTSSQHGNKARIRLPFSYQVSRLAVGGLYLYVLPGLSDELVAYDRATGKLVRKVTLPSSPDELTVGPGGLVWVSFTGNSDGSPYGIWVLSPDLRLHSAITDVTPSAIVPVSRTVAWVTDQYGLYRLSMPAPGTTGPATDVLEPGTSIGPPLNTAPGPGVLVSGHVVVEVTNGYGYHGHLVIAGQPSVTYGGGQSVVQGVTRVGGSLWAISGGDALNYGGALVRLDSDLRPTTPASVGRSRVLSQVAAVWSHGDTVWVALGPQGWEGGRSLACFRAGPGIGPVTTLPVTGQVVALAAATDTVYVSAAPPGEGGGGYGDGMTSYRVPAACR
jgi:hypothetical protein